MEEINNSNFTILIVDDIPQNLQVLGSTLKKQDYKIEFATDGLKALEWINKRNFDLILLDVMMPQMDGFQVCEKIRKNTAYDETPIIFLTAKSDTQSILKGFELGAQDYISKPFDSRELLARVRTHIEIKHNREKLNTVNKWLEEKVIERTIKLRDAYKKLQKANAELLDLDKAKSDFLGIISHEIRTPLNGIIAPVKMLKDQLQSTNLANLLYILDNSVDRLEKFSLLALQISNLKMSKHKLVKQFVPLHDLINNSVHELDEQIKKKELSIKIDEIPSSLTINGESNLLQICLDNILENAIKFTDEKSTITVKVDHANEFTSCEIIDQGKGFSEKALNNLFKLFSPGEPHVDQNIGLDLSLVKMIMDAHSGKIEVKNLSSGGASVKLIFPIKPSE